MSDIKRVSVPLDLLAAVLETAESDSYSTESEFACSEADAAAYAQARALIADLRRIAGIDGPRVSGHEFSGMALAVKDQPSS